MSEDIHKEKIRNEEIYRERERFLLDTDSIIYDILDRIPVDKTRAQSRKARPFCGGLLIDTQNAPVAITQTGEQFFVCNDHCRMFLETAVPEQIRSIPDIKTC